MFKDPRKSLPFKSQVKNYGKQQNLTIQGMFYLTVLTKLPLEYKELT